MNDRELMKRLYDRRCADEMTAAEILEGSTEPARVRSRAPVLAAAAAAAVALGVGTALFVKYKAAPTAAGEPSAGQAEDITPVSSAADTSSDPWEPNAVSMPDPFRQEGMTSATEYNGNESRDVIEYMESTGDGADSSRSEQTVPKSDRMKPAVIVWNDQTKADGFGDEYFDFNAFSGTFTLDAFPGVEFKWEDSRISVTENGKC